MSITDTAKWRACYDDGTFLYEMDPSGGKQNLFTDIDFDRIVAFQLVNEKDIAICQVNLGNGKRLIFTRRNQMITGSLFNTEGGVPVPIPMKSHQRIIVLGWQKTINGVNTKAIFYLLPDGRIEMDDEWREDAVHSKVNTPGLLGVQVNVPDKSKSTKIVDKKEPQEKVYSGSNDSAFKNKK